MTRTTNRAVASDEFLRERETILRTALEVYARNMREESTNALTAYDNVSTNPEASAAQDKSMITTHGLRMAGEMFAACAKRAEHALRELDTILETIEERDE